MIVSRKIILLVIATGCLLISTGCINKFKGNFRFENESTSGIWVKDPVCFESNPPCGYLSPGAGASSSLFQRMPIPDECILTWRYTEIVDDKWVHQPYTKSAVSLKKIPKDFDGEILFIFLSNRTWTVKAGDE